MFVFLLLYRSVRSEPTCPEESVPCLNPPCEDAYSRCSPHMVLFDENVSKDPNFSGEGGVSFTVINRYLMANRPIYQSDQTCMWWHRSGRRWWIGYCEDLGTDYGFAYLEEDFNCPSRGTWRRRDNEERISDLVDSNLDFKVGYICNLCGAPFVELEFLTAAVGVNFVKQNNRYQQPCVSKFIGGRFKCVGKKRPVS